MGSRSSYLTQLFISCTLVAVADILVAILKLHESFEAANLEKMKAVKFNCHFDLILIPLVIPLLILAEW